MPTPFYFIFAAMLFRDVIGQAEDQEETGEFGEAKPNESRPAFPRQ